MAREVVAEGLGAALLAATAAYLTDRYSERKEDAAKLEARVNLRAI